MAATLTGSKVPDNAGLSSLTHWRWQSRFSVFCHELPPHIVFLTLKKNYNKNFSGVPLSLWKRQETSTSPMSLSRAVINNNNTNNNIMNESPPFLRPVQPDFTLVCIQNLRALHQIGKKRRKYYENYLGLGFTWIGDKDCPKPKLFYSVSDYFKCENALLWSWLFYYVCSGHLSIIKHAAFNMAMRNLVAFFNLFFLKVLRIGGVSNRLGHKKVWEPL